jgi:hypothetical protein
VSHSRAHTAAPRVLAAAHRDARSQAAGVQQSGPGGKCAPPDPRPPVSASPGTCQGHPALTEPARQRHGRPAAATPPPQATPPPDNRTPGIRRHPRPMCPRPAPAQSQAPNSETPGQAASTRKQSQARVRNPRPTNRTSSRIQSLNSHPTVSIHVFEKPAHPNCMGTTGELYRRSRTT